MVDAPDTTGGALLQFYDWAGRKGVLPANTARMLKLAVSRVLENVDGWESLDVRGIDQEGTLRRFRNLRAHDFKPESLQTYEHRFRQAIRLFLEHSADPSGWRYLGRPRRLAPSPKTDEVSNSENELSTEETVAPRQTAMGLVEYPFPLREGRLAFLRLPVDLRMSEVRRLTAYMSTLAIDSDAEDR
jgi:hypothetical protein